MQHPVAGNLGFRVSVLFLFWHKLTHLLSKVLRRE